MELPAVWGVHSISEELFRCIRHFVPQGATFLEFGSGWATSQLGKFYKLYSVEHNEAFLNLYPCSTYIYALYKDGFYDLDVVHPESIPYAGVLVDGNDADNRIGGLTDESKLRRFNWDIPWFFDDLNIDPIRNNFEEICRKLNRPYVKYQSGPKPFGVLLGKPIENILWHQ